jgi:uncharacterized protein YndB with AHSA1/START domain
MARNEVLIDAAPEQVFAVLADPQAYPEWVLGAQQVREADRSWPAPGSRFSHRVGVGPLRTGGHAEVVRLQRPMLLELRATAWPLAAARITIQLMPEAGGTRVVVIEDPDYPLGSLLLTPLGHAGLRLRNHEALARLRVLVEGRPQRTS